MTMKAPLRVAVACAVCVSATVALMTTRPAMPAPQSPIAPNVMGQIEALIREKALRTTAERKIDSQLLYALRQSRGRAPAPGAAQMNVDLPASTDGRIAIDVRARTTAELVASVGRLGA